MLTSSWYTTDERKEFLKIVKCGDLLEFKRNGYQHWVVYVGRPANFKRYLASRSLKRDVEYVIHRANPGDSDFLSFSGRSRSSAKGLHGIGNIVVDELDDVWNCSEVRKNNSRDASFDAVDVETIFDRAFAGFDDGFDRDGRAGGDREESEDYHLIFNNCEHFANYCRYGIKWSSQAVAGAALTAVAGIGVACVAYKFLKWLSPDKEDDRAQRGRSMFM